MVWWVAEYVGKISSIDKILDWVSEQDPIEIDLRKNVEGMFCTAGPRKVSNQQSSNAKRIKCWGD